MNKLIYIYNEIVFKIEFYKIIKKSKKNEIQKKKTKKKEKPNREKFFSKVQKKF